MDNTSMYENNFLSFANKPFVHMNEIDVHFVLEL